MMNMKRAVMMAVLAVAIAALALPMIGLKANVSASRSNVVPASSAKATKAALATAASVPQEQGAGQQVVLDNSAAPSDESKLDESLIRSMGFNGLPNGLTSQEVGQKVAQALAKKGAAGSKALAAEEPRSGQPRIAGMSNAAFSAALGVAIGGRDTQFSEVVLLADWDGREDCAADREAKVDDFSEIEIEIDQVLTRTAISAHSRANGFNENIFYYSDSAGNVYVGADTTNFNTNLPLVEPLNVFQINLPTALNAFGSLQSDDQVTITGLAVSPVSDLRSFFNVNGGYTDFQNVTDGEILYVSFWDTEGGLRLTTGNQLVRSGVLAFPISDAVTPAVPGTATISAPGYPVTIGQAFGVLFSTFCNVGGICVDDDANLYFHQADLLNVANGANIVKVTDTGSNQDRSLAVSGILTITSLNPSGGVYGTTSGPSTQVNRFTNYSGTSTVFGNIVSIACGPCNTIYAAVSQSAPATGATLAQGRFQAPAAFPNGLPNMIISFADCGGAFDVCSGEAFFQVDPNVGGVLPVADGFADAADFGTWRVFVVGNGPALPGGISTNSGNIPPTQHIDFQIDYSGVHSGIVVNEEGTVFFISGGAPAADIGISPLLGEILCFEDMCPMDRRADYVDLRGNALPNPPASGGNVGDGDSDRFDHIFYIAPLDQVSIAPTGLAGLSKGHLRYMNRLAPNAIGPGVTLGVSDPVLGDDDFDGPIIFEAFDPSHQVAGGDDQNTPFRGDDDNGAGNPVITGPLSGGFEFVFGGPVGVSNCVWNGFFWNSNGNITFGGGDNNNQANAVVFRAGLPKIAPAWADFDPSTRVDGNLNTYPVMAAGFANVNSFRIRFINFVEFGSAGGPGSDTVPFAQCGQRNTFSILLLDDGTGVDENASQALNPANPIGNNSVPFDLLEGPTDLRFEPPPVAGASPVGCSPRSEGTGHFIFEYCRMDLLGTKDRPVLTGYSIGFLNPLNPPGLCASNLSCLAREADLGAFGVIPNCNQAQVASICPCLIGEGTEPTIYELFNTGSDASISPQGTVTLARPSFDLRFEGNDAASCTPTRQDDNNRGKVGFYGIGCAAPPNPICRQVILRPTAFTPNAGTDIIDALCEVPVDIVGCGFFPNEVTTICSGIGTETGLPIQRPGKTVTTTIALLCDTDGNGVVDTTISNLTNVNPVSKNLIQAVIPRVAIGNTPATATSTAFPLACCAGVGRLDINTAFSSGDNNVFGPFNRTTTCAITLGNRAPVVVSASPSSGDCSTGQDLLVVGSCFLTPGTVTSVFALEQGNTANRINGQFVVFSNTLLDAFFNFGSANAGKTFLIFVQGPGGISRNLSALQTGQTCNVLGNEQGVTVTFKCNAPGTPPGGGTTPTDVAVINACKVNRRASGAFQVVVTGSNLKQGAALTISGQAPNKLKFKGLTSGSNVVTKIIGKGNICSLLPGPIIVTNPGPDAGPSQPFVCNQTCSTN